MKKIILAVAVAALAVMAVASSASADVLRCDNITSTTTITTATFTFTEPAEVDHQFGVVWTHKYTVIVQPNGSFIGTGEQFSPSNTLAYTENISGSFANNYGTVSFLTERSDGLVHSVNNAPTNNTLWNGTATLGSTTNPIDVHVSNPVVTTDTATTTEAVKNHGQYVKAMSGGKVAAQACAGMPVNSTQGS